MSTFTIFENEFCEVVALNQPDPAQKEVLLSFTGVGHAMGAIDVQKIEFFGAGRGFDNVIFIKDIKRSWGNALDFEEITSVLHPYVDGRRVCAIGNSMGGFLSVVVSDFIEVDTVVALVPQFSVSYEVVPNERRWRPYRNAITEFKFLSLETCFNQTTQYYLFSGEGPEEEQHWSQFPKQDNIHNIVVAGTDHFLSRHMKENGVLQDAINKCFAQEFTVDWLSERLGVEVWRK